MKIVKRVVVVASLAGLAFWIYLSVQDRRELARRIHQAKDILVACKLYAKDHRGHMPSSFDQLLPLRDKSDGHLYYADSAGGMGGFLERASRELEFVSADLTETSDPSLILVRERRSDSRGRRVVGYVDASARVIQEDH